METVDEDSDEDDDEDAKMLRQALKMSMGQAAPLGFFPPDADEFSFVTEVFFLAHRAISSCLLPLWSEMTEQVHLLYDLSGPRGQKLDEPSQRRINLHGDGWACALEDPRLLEDAGAFATFAVRSRRPAVLRCLHAIDARRVQQMRSWVVSFSNLGLFGPRRETTMLRAGGMVARPTQSSGCARTGLETTCGTREGRLRPVDAFSESWREDR